MIRAALDAYAKAQPDAFTNERLQTIGASEIGLCERRTWFTKNETPHDVGYDDKWGAKQRGTIYERAWWNPAMESAFGDRLKFAGANQKTFFDGYLSATPDALITGLPRDALAALGVPDIEGDAIVVDCKSLDPRVKLEEAKPEHRYQLMVQIGLIRRRTNFAPMWGILSYTDTSFWDEGNEYPYRYEESIYLAAQDRARRIMGATDPFALKPEGKIAGGKECDYCPYLKRCGQVQVERVTALEDAQVDDPRVAAELVILARSARAAKAEAEAAEARQRELEYQIKDALQLIGRRRASFGDVSISWGTVKGRQSYDMKGIRKAAEEAGIDVEQFSTMGEATDRLTVTVKKSK